MSNTANEVVDVVVEERYFSVDVLPSYVMVVTADAFVPIVIFTNPILCVTENASEAAPLAFPTCRSLLR